MDLTDSNTKIFIFPLEDLGTRNCWVVVALAESTKVSCQPLRLRLQWKGCLMNRDRGRGIFGEIVSIGHLLHRNLVPLLGYCRRKGELLLVYDYMPNGSSDKYLYDQPTVTLNWSQWFRVIKGAASGLFYLHEEWEQVVVHWDVKASNVLLDGELNGWLGDFGLARLYDHGTDPQTTHVVGTLGYILHLSMHEMERRRQALMCFFLGPSCLRLLLVEDQYNRQRM